MKEKAIIILSNAKSICLRSAVTGKNTLMKYEEKTPLIITIMVQETL